MAQRNTPEQIFSTRLQTQVQEPLPVIQLQTEPLALSLDPNMMFILGLVAIVGLLGLFALLGSKK